MPPYSGTYLFGELCRSAYQSLQEASDGLHNNAFSSLQNSILQRIEDMPTFRSTVQTAITALSIIDGQALAGSVKGCPNNNTLSCHNSTAIKDTCCTNSPGGLLLQTQFWDTGEAHFSCYTWHICDVHDVFCAVFCKLYRTIRLLSLSYYSLGPLIRVMYSHWCF